MDGNAILIHYHQIYAYIICILYINGVHFVVRMVVR